MARGRKTSEAKKEQVKALLYLNPDASDTDIARETNLPRSTVHYIKRDVMDTDDFEQVRQAKKAEFISEAWDTVKRIHLKINEKLDTLDLEQLQKVNIRDLAVALGTIYDKQALASGEPTIISERHEPTPDLVQELEAKIQRLKQMTGTQA